MSDDDGKYFKYIMENIITSSNNCLPAMHALNLTTGLKITKLHAEELIAEWSDRGYFVSMDDVVHPGPRLISEFSDVLRTKYKEHIHSCYLCKQIIFQVSEWQLFRCSAISERNFYGISVYLLQFAGTKLST